MSNQWLELLLHGMSQAYDASGCGTIALSNATVALHDNISGFDTGVVCKVPLPRTSFVHRQVCQAVYNFVVSHWHPENKVTPNTEC